MTATAFRIWSDVVALADSDPDFERLVRQEEEALGHLSPMARRVQANKQEGRRLVDEVAYAGVRPEGIDR